MKKVIAGLVGLGILIGVLSLSVINTGDENYHEIKSDITVKTDGTISNTPKVSVNYKINENNQVDITVFGNYLQKNRFMWANYNENGELVEILHEPIFAYPFKYQTLPLKDKQTNRLIIWNEELNKPLINQIINNEEK